MNSSINTIMLRVAWKREQQYPWQYDESPNQVLSNRELFWEPIVRETSPRPSIDELEARLENEFGPQLRLALERRFKEPWEALYGRESNPRLEEEFQRWLRLIADLEQRTRSERIVTSEQILLMARDALTPLTEFIRLKREDVESTKLSSNYQKQLELLNSIAKISFSAKVVSYSSVNLGIAVGGISQLVNLFENDFDAFRVFLDSYIPNALSFAIGKTISHQMTYDLQIPNSIKEEFTQHSNSIKEEFTQHPQSVSDLNPSEDRRLVRKNAEWIWILSNTSLVIPVFLALGIIYFATITMQSMNRDIAAEQKELIKQERQHLVDIKKDQNELIKQERQRFSSIQSAQDKYMQKRLEEN